MINIFENISPNNSEESIEILYKNMNSRIERIISSGQTTPENIWYDQIEEEWIVLLQGEAVLLIKKMDNDPDWEKDTKTNSNMYKEIKLKKGDTFLIKAHQKHRVIYTSQNPPCIWLCYFQE